MALKNLREDTVVTQERLTKHQQARSKVRHEATEEGPKRLPREKVKREETGKWVKHIEDYQQEDDYLELE